MTTLRCEICDDVLLEYNDEIVTIWDPYGKWPPLHVFPPSLDERAVEHREIRRRHLEERHPPRQGRRFGWKWMIR